MRRTFCALCTAWVAIMRPCISSRTAMEVAIHQSRDVAVPVSRARVEVRWRTIEALKASAGSSVARWCGGRALAGTGLPLAAGLAGLAEWDAAFLALEAAGM